MIIMRRIIQALAIATLTACGGPAQDAPAPDGSSADTTPSSPDAAPDSLRHVLFMGTSLTAGYGVGAELAFPALIQLRIDSAGLPFRVDNAGVSGETSAGGLRRADWLLQKVPDVLVIELGANDGLRGIDPADMHRNLDAILDRARTLNPDLAIVILGMEAPPNLGDDYTSRFRQVFQQLARKYDAVLVPFLLDGVAGNPALNIDDGIHPSAEGHRIVAATVWNALAPVLRARAAQRASTDSS
jgi:acyl-CoA thioesterase I